MLLHFPIYFSKSLSVHWLLCKDLCLPVKGFLTYDRWNKEHLLVGIFRDFKGGNYLYRYEYRFWEVYKIACFAQNRACDIADIIS